MIDYRLAIAERGTSGLGTVITDLDDVLNTIGTLKGARLEFAEELGAPGSLEFSLPIDHDMVTVDNFQPGAREVHLYRDEVLVWGGKIWVADASGWEVRFACYGWSYDLQKRYIDGDYAAVKDQFAIARELIRFAQGDDGNPWGKAQRGLGLTVAGTGTSGVTRKVIVCVEERMLVSDALDEMAQAKDGFDWWFGPDKQLNLAHPARTRATGLTFTGQDNLSEVGYQMDATEMFNDISIVGPDDDDCAIPSIYSTFDSTNRTKYGLLEGNAEFESGAEAKNKVDQDHLEKVADEELRISKDPRFQPDLTSPTDLQEASTEGSFAYDEVQIGDVITVETTRGPVGGFGRFNRQFRIVKKQTSVAGPGRPVEYVTVTVDQALPEDS